MTNPNRQIVQFLKLSQQEQNYYYIPYYGRGYKLEDFEFLGNWDWLMYLVEQIETNEFVDEFNISFCSVYGHTVEILPRLKDSFSPIRHNVQNGDKKDIIYDACLDFIKWHNSKQS